MNDREKITHTFTLSQIIQGGAIIVGFAIGWGVLSTKVDGVTDNLNKYTDSNNRTIQELVKNDRDQDIELAKHDQALHSAGLISKLLIIPKSTIASGQSATLTPTPAPTPQVIAYNYSVENNTVGPTLAMATPTSVPTPTKEPKPTPIITGIIHNILDVISL